MWTCVHWDCFCSPMFSSALSVQCRVEHSLILQILHHTCIIGHAKCKDNVRLCVPWCDGVAKCLDRSDETNCELFHCIPGQRKCADNTQCIADDKVCDGDIDCRDMSDELCESKCLPKYFDVNKFVGKRCSENSGICFPVEKFCDRVTDCPLGSDEALSDCTCQQWGLYECKLNIYLCILIYSYQAF